MKTVQNTQFDFLIIGSGFGGSVAAMRLAQKGYRVAILEAGKRLRAHDFPKTNWQTTKYFWAPLFRCYGLQNITLLKGVMVLHGAGVGGGSLVYANTLMKPLPAFYKDPAWPKGFDWEMELEPHYEMGKKMLGVTPNRHFFEGEEALRRVGRRMGIEETFEATDVAVYFGQANQKVKDPYFNGSGPDRTGCNFCGGCMVGCRFGAKNTLDQNYLYFAEKWGAQVFPETKATRITPLAEGGYQVETAVSTSWFKKAGQTFLAKNVIFSAGVLGTVELLFQNKEVHKTLPNLSNCLGDRVRTNGESLLGATSFEQHRDLSKGIAIGAAIHPDAVTKIESVRYPSGSGAMQMLAVPLTAEGSWLTRPLKLIKNFVLRFPRMIKLYLLKDWARSTLILLVMQSIDRQMRLKLGRSIMSGFRKTIQGFATDKPVPSYLPVAQEAAKLLAEEIHGEPQNIFSEVVLGTPATAHILGGCCMGETKETGVINSRHEIFGYKGLYVCDGSVIPANLGVNPSLTITAMAERFASQFAVNTQAPAEILGKRKIVFSKELA